MGTVTLEGVKRYEMEDCKCVCAKRSAGTKCLKMRVKHEGAGLNGWRKGPGVECDERASRERKGEAWKMAVRRPVALRDFRDGATAREDRTWSWRQQKGKC